MRLHLTQNLCVDVLPVIPDFSLHLEQTSE